MINGKHPCAIALKSTPGTTQSSTQLLTIGRQHILNAYKTIRSVEMKKCQAHIIRKHMVMKISHYSVSLVVGEATRNKAVGCSNAPNDLFVFTFAGIQVHQSRGRVIEFIRLAYCRPNIDVMRFGYRIKNWNYLKKLTAAQRRNTLHFSRIQLPLIDKKRKTCFH